MRKPGLSLGPATDVHPWRGEWLLGTVGAERAERQHVQSHTHSGHHDSRDHVSDGPGVSGGEGPGDEVWGDPGQPGDGQQPVHERRGPDHGEAGVRGGGRGLVSPGDGQQR